MKALVVGINDYKISPLSGCINDANAVRDLLSVNGDGSPNFSVKLETTIEKKAELKKSISQLFAGEGNIALFYFSGHGTINECGGYLVTPDANAYDEGVALIDVLKYANDSKFRNKIIILDCCNSGSAGNSPFNNAKDDSLSFISCGTTILTACATNEYALESNGHGVFTALLIEALRGGAADINGNITLGGIYAFIDKALGPWEQRPIFKTNIKNFSPIRKISPKVPISILRKLTEYFVTPEVQIQLNPSFEFTNTPDYKPEIQEPYSNEKNVTIFKNLQQFASIGLVVPEGEEHMYFAAMKSKSCRLTALGAYYWKLVKNNRI